MWRFCLFVLLIGSQCQSPGESRRSGIPLQGSTYLQTLKKEKSHLWLHNENQKSLFIHKFFKNREVNYPNSLTPRTSKLTANKENSLPSPAALGLHCCLFPSPSHKGGKYFPGCRSWPTNLATTASERSYSLNVCLYESFWAWNIPPTSTIKTFFHFFSFP